MRFAQKLTLAVVLLLSATLCVVSTITAGSNFDAALDSSVRQNVEQHLVERYSLESDLLSTRGGVNTLNDEALQRYGGEITSYVGSSSRWLGLYDENGRMIYANIPDTIQRNVSLADLQHEEQGYTIRQYGDEYAMLVASTIETGGGDLYLLSVYDISPVFLERDRQMWDMLRIDAITLVIAALATAAISRGLTKPLRKLNLASRKIAGGAYSTRSLVKGKDEVAELSENFNKMAAAVEAQVDKLNASVQQREDFVAAFTHEVKTPMTAIIGYSDILRSRQTDAETRQRAAQFIYRESKRLESLSQKLLVLMGLSSKEAELLPISLNALFSDAARSLIPALGEYELAFMQAEDITVMADKDLVTDLLRNLVLNALKATPRDGFVRIGYSISKEGCRVAVADKGCGIPPEELARITEPFYMVDKSRARREGGSGVGLALAKRITELHGTQLTFESEVGIGTTVSFVLAQA